MNTNLIFNWRHLNDKRLYSDNIYALDVLYANLNSEIDGLSARLDSGNSITYHAYWYGEFGLKQAFSLKSFLCSQNLSICKVILWLDISTYTPDHLKNEYLAPLLPFIEVKLYSPYLEVKGTIWENHSYLPAQDIDLVARADAFRFLILFKYGGLYFDLDIMFLRDLGSLLNTEFCYAWEFQPYANSAVLNLKRGSATAEYLMEKSIALRTPSPWYVFVYSDLNLSSLTVLPCTFFDPLWMGLPKERSPFQDFTGFFKPLVGDFANNLKILSFKDFFPGSYAYHWHNQWQAPEVKNSFFGIFNHEFDKILGL